jgi:hypothetical protein
MDMEYPIWIALPRKPMERVNRSRVLDRNSNSIADIAASESLERPTSPFRMCSVLSFRRFQTRWDLPELSQHQRNSDSLIHRLPARDDWLGVLICQPLLGREHRRPREDDGQEVPERGCERAGQGVRMESLRSEQTSA